MRTQYTSKELFHFVGHNHPNDDERNFEKLKNILSDCCVSHYPHENNWGAVSHKVYWDKSLIKEELIVPTVTCYADIPWDSLSIHVEKYGRFGLSLPKDLLIKYGARPVMYIPMRHDDWAGKSGETLLKDLEAVYKGYHEQVSSKLTNFNGVSSRSLGKVPNTEHEAIEAIESVFVKDLLGYIKPFNSHLDERHSDNFYMEREWRKLGNMKFSPDDVCKVIIAEGYLDRMKKTFPYYADRIKEI